MKTLTIPVPDPRPFQPQTAPTSTDFAVQLAGIRFVPIARSGRSVYVNEQVGLVVKAEPDRDCTLACQCCTELCVWRDASPTVRRWLVPTLAAGHTAGYAWCLQHYVPPSSERAGPFTLGRMRAQLVAAGIGDVEEENVVLDRATGQAVLVDYGLARPDSRSPCARAASLQTLLASV